MPQNHIFIFSAVIPLHPRLDAMAFFTLVRKLACCVQLVVLVLGYPDGFSSEFCSFIVHGIGAGEHHLTRCCLEFIGHGFVCDGVSGGVVSDLEDAVAVDACVCSA